jgi:serine/threonine protein kinase
MTEHYFDAGIGTLNYMAPEIIKNFINYNNTIDSWYTIINYLTKVVYIAIY